MSEKRASKNNPMEDPSHLIDAGEQEATNAGDKAELEDREFRLKRFVIRWIIIIGAAWLGFVVITFWLITKKDTGIAIALIASGTSAAVIGPMLVAYAVFRKKFTNNWLGKAAQFTKTDSYS